jgi:hypothetical protein
MALWLAIQVIQIGIFDQFDQANWLFSFTRKIENSSAVSAQWRPGVSSGISKLIRIRLGGSTSLVVVDRLSLTSH